MAASRNRGKGGQAFEKTSDTYVADRVKQMAKDIQNLTEAQRYDFLKHLDYKDLRALSALGVLTPKEMPLLRNTRRWQ